LRKGTQFIIISKLKRENKRHFFGGFLTWAKGREEELQIKIIVLFAHRLRYRFFYKNKKIVIIFAADQVYCRCIKKCSLFPVTPSRII